MSRFVQAVLSRFRGSVGDRRAEPRIKVRLRFTISAQERGASGGPRRMQFSGNTLDISNNSLGLVFHSVQIETYYLIIDGRPLNLVLELPSGSVRMSVAPARSEKLGGANGGCVYLIGARIESMSDDDRQRYLAYLLPKLKTKPSLT